MSNGIVRSGAYDGNGITQGAAQAVKDGCAQQKGLNVFRLLVENFFDQIVYDVTVVAGESPDELGNVIAPAH